MQERITIHTINTRLRHCYGSFSEGVSSHYNIDEMATTLPKDIMRSIEIICNNSKPIQFESVLNLFDKLYESNCTTGQLRKMGNYICEEATPKVRDAKTTNTNLRRKIGNLRSKVTTKVNNNIEDAKDTVDKAVASVKSNFKASTTQIKSNVKSGLGVKPKAETYLDCYDAISSRLALYAECDVIISNYNDFSKRYNLERLFVDNTRINGVLDTVTEVCRLADTYSNPNKTKFMVSIESCWYGFEHNGIEYSKTDILEAALDYFLLRESCYDNYISVVKNSRIFDPDDLPEDMQVITEIDPEAPDDFPSMYNNITNQISKTESATIGLREVTDFNKIFSDYKKQNDAKETKLQFLVRKLYTKNVSSIVDDTPNFLGWIRRLFILSTCAINPVITAVLLIGDLFVQLHMERNEVEKMLKCFDNEIKEANKKLKSTKSQQEKERLEKYIKSLKDARKKIDGYYEKMLSDKELDEKLYGSDEKDSFDDLKKDITGEDKDDDFDFDDDDFDFDDDDDDFNEAAAISVINQVSDIVDTVNKYKDTIGSDTINSIDMFNGDNLDGLAKLSVEYPEVWAPELLEYALESRVNAIRKNKVVFESPMDRFTAINACESAIATLHTYQPTPSSTIGECIAKTQILEGCIDSINWIISSYRNRSTMVEASFTNSLKLAAEKLKKNIVKLSDKEKSMSRSVDVSMSQIKKAMDNAVSNENREMVIKGSVLPPASKIIKLAITTGAVWLINPAVAVIGCLGYLGISAKHRKKEKMLILDELEVELKMCDKYIDIAESKNDMKALKQLYSIKKNLERQHQRIKYNMKVQYNQNVHSTEDFN